MKKSIFLLASILLVTVSVIVAPQKADTAEEERCGAGYNFDGSYTPPDPELKAALERYYRENPIEVSIPPAPSDALSDEEVLRQLFEEAHQEQNKFLSRINKVYAFLTKRSGATYKKGATWLEEEPSIAYASVVYAIGSNVTAEERDLLLFYLADWYGCFNNVVTSPVVNEVATPAQELAKYREMMALIARATKMTHEELIDMYHEIEP